LCGISGKFKELWNKGKAESPQPAYAAAGAAPVYEAQPAAPVQTQAPPPGEVKFCGQCGAKNAAGAGFCGECGAKM